MGTSIILEQRRILLDAIRGTVGPQQWMVLVLDAGSRRLVDSITKEDDILNLNITNIEQIEDRRPLNPDTDVVYLLSPLPHIIECLKADLARKRYRRAYLRWTSALPPALYEEIFRSESRRERIVNTHNLDIDFFSRESHLITFQEPWSFHTLFHPDCDALVKAHLDSLTHKIVSICVTLREYPLVRYYRPRHMRHAASVLCSHLASFVQSALDAYARHNPNMFPHMTAGSRPRGVLFITDRSMDLMSPLVHEFTYQAMALDLLPIRDEGKVMYTNVIRRGQRDQEEKDVELSERDKIWVANRHLHMKDLLPKIVDDFKKFQADHPQFAEHDGAPTSVNTIKDMIAGLPQFQEGKEAFSLHLDMAEKCVKIFQDHKLMDLGSIEQSLATGLDEDYKKPKNLADQMARLLDDDSVIHEDRLRLLVMYILYRNGILRGDIEKLRCHGQLSPMDGEIVYNLDILGARVEKPLKEKAEPPPPLFEPKIPANAQNEEVSLSRFEPALRYMLEEYCTGTLDSTVFPPVKPHLDNANSQAAVSQTSLRSASKPTWARTKPTSSESRQRILVFMAGGATYAEARACYEVSRSMGREVYLATSHMHTPKTFLRQVSLLSASRRQLDLPGNQPPPRLPAWVTEKEVQPGAQPAAQSRAPAPQQPPAEAMSRMAIGSGSANGHDRSNGAPVPANPAPRDESSKLHKDKKDKKKFGLFKH